MGRRVHAHQVGWYLAHEQWAPTGKVVMHRCDVKLCVRGDHLTLGTQKENMHDMIRKNGSPSAKLREDQVEEIKRRRAKGESIKDLATAFGIAPVTVGRIVKGQTWRVRKGDSPKGAAENK